MTPLNAVKLPPALYIVATPIGSARDITLRALDVLGTVDIIAAEDTRTTRKLLKLHGISLEGCKLIAYHDHNGMAKRPYILEALDNRCAVALVSEAGTPLIADPGYKLVQAVRAAGHSVVPVPGVSAVITALSVAAQPTDTFFFAGFSPNKSTARQAYFQTLVNIPGTLVFYESPKRLSACLTDMVKIFGAERLATVCRELTKKFEEVRLAPLETLRQHYADVPPPKGEIVIIVEPPLKSTVSQSEIDNLLLSTLKDMHVKEAAQYVARQTGLPRKDIYTRALELRERE